MIIAQISDMHIRPRGVLAFGRLDTAACLARCVAQIRRADPQPDIVVATGDLVDAGLPEEYRHLRELLAPLPMPVYLLPGNHDERTAFAGEFADHGYLRGGGEFLHYTVEGPPLRLIVLDTLVPGKTGGLLCEERLAWLAARLEEAPARPTAIFMHHPPFLTGIRHMDDLALANGPEMGRVVARHPQVERVICGHLHRPIQVRWHGTVAMSAPSTAHQVALDLRPDGPAAFNMEPPAFLLHVWHDVSGLITHTSYVGEFPGPYLFKDGSEVAGR
jgi:3',5'-cyclic-AMP phosphodiesterase